MPVWSRASLVRHRSRLGALPSSPVTAALGHHLLPVLIIVTRCAEVDRLIDISRACYTNERSATTGVSLLSMPDCTWDVHVLEKLLLRELLAGEGVVELEGLHRRGGDSCGVHRYPTVKGGL